MTHGRYTLAVPEDVRRNERAALRRAALKSHLANSIMPLRELGQRWRPLIERAIETLALDAPEFDPRPLLQRGPDLLDLVVRWNARVDLTSAESPELLVDLYVADAVVLALHTPIEQHSGRWVDIGTGGGAPGLPLALLLPGASVTLVEPRAKRVAFLRTSLATLGASNVSVVRGRSEGLEADSYEVACSRATLPPQAWLAEGARLAPSVWVLLARDPEPELPGMRQSVNLAYTWSLTGAPRRAIRYDRIRD